MHVINARVEYSHHHAATARADRPGFRRVDIGVVRANDGAVVIQADQLTELRIVGGLSRCLATDAAIGFDIGDG